MAHRQWSPEERAIITRLWPDKAEIQRALPHRSLQRITETAATCGVRKRIHFWTADQDSRLRRMVNDQVPRRRVAEALGLSLMQVQNRLKYAGISYERRAYRSVLDDLTEAIRRRAEALGLTLVELDRLCKSGKAFQHTSRRRPIGISNALKAIRLLGGRIDVEWQPLDDDA